MQALHARTGTELILFAVRSSLDAYLCPMSIYTSERAPEFFSLTMDHALPDVAMRFEAYCLSGVQGSFQLLVQYQSTSLLICCRCCKYIC